MDVKTIIRSAAWAAIGSWGGRLINIALFIILTRSLPPEAIGAMALIATYLMFIQIFGDPGFSDFIIQHQTRSEIQEISIFWTQLSLGLLFSLLLWLLAPYLAKTLSATVPGTQIIRVMAFIPPFAALGLVAEALLRKRLAFKNLALRSLIAAVIGGVCALAAIYKGLGIWALVIKQFVEVIVNVIAQLHFSKWRPKLTFSRSALVDPLRFGSVIFGTRLIVLCHNRVDTLIVGWFLGSTALGYYSIAQRLCQIVSDLLNGVIGSVGAPLMAHAKRSPNELAIAFLRLVKGGSSLSMPAYAVLMMSAPLVVDVVFGSKWSSASGALIFLCATGIVTGPLWFNGAAMQVTNNASRWMGVVAVYVVVGSIFLSIGSMWQLQGVAIGIFCRALLLAPLSSYVATRAVGIDFRRYCRAWFPSVIIASVSAFSVGLTYLLIEKFVISEKIRLIIMLLIGGVSSVLLILVFSPQIYLQIKEKIKWKRKLA